MRSWDRLIGALNLLTLEADDCQIDLQARIAAATDGQIGPIGIGRILVMGRRVDTLERITREINQLLDDRPNNPPTAASEARAA
jgi:hypothetical protein